MAMLVNLLLVLAVFVCTLQSLVVAEVTVIAPPQTCALKAYAQRNTHARSLQNLVQRAPLAIMARESV